MKRIRKWVNLLVAVPVWSTQPESFETMRLRSCNKLRAATIIFHRSFLRLCSMDWLKGTPTGNYGFLPPKRGLSCRFSIQTIQSCLTSRITHLQGESPHGIFLETERELLGAALPFICVPWCPGESWMFNQHTLKVILRLKSLTKGQDYSLLSNMMFPHILTSFNQKNMGNPLGGVLANV